MLSPLRHLAPIMLVAGALGCGPAAPPAAPPRPSAPAATGHSSHDHDHGHGHDEHEPASFADGVSKLKTLAADLADRLAENAAHEADDAVHGIGHLLEALRDQAAKEGLAAAATKGLDELEECFGKVDEAFHSGDKDADPKAVLESVRERLEAAITALTEVK